MVSKVDTDSLLPLGDSKNILNFLLDLLFHTKQANIDLVILRTRITDDGNDGINNRYKYHRTALSEFLLQILND